MVKQKTNTSAKGLSKYTAPISAHWLRRSRLFELLDQLAASPVVWITAPAGCGKTVLAASYLAERKRPMLWYRMDERDTDPGAFFHRLREAAQQCGIEGANKLPFLTGEYTGGEQVFARNFAETLYAGAPQGFVLVFDDFQQLPARAPLQSLLPAILDSVPSSCTVFILSRHSPPPQVARLRANQQIGLLGEAELRLDEEEIVGLVASISGDSLSRAEIDALHQRMHGWVAGVVLTLDHRGRDTLKEMPTLDSDVIFDYFATEVVAALDETEREFLLVTSLSVQFDEILAQEMSGNPHTVNILHKLLRRNFFIYREGESYRYHPLFRDFLQRLVQRQWTLETLTQKRLSVAMLLLKRNEADMALPLLRDVGDWERFVATLLQLAPAMMAQGRHRELEGWLQSIPSHLFAAQPWLDFWLATSHLPTDYFTSYKLYKRAYTSFVEQDDGQGGVLAWIGAVDAIIFSLSEVSRLDFWLQQLEKVMAQHIVKMDEQLTGQLASRVMTIFTLRQPEHAELNHWRKVAEEALSDIADVNQRTLSCFYLCTHSIWGGELAQADALRGLSLDKAGENLPPLAATTDILAQAWLGWTSGDYKACKQIFSSGLKLADESGVHVWTVILWLQGVTNALIHGELEEAGDYLANLEPVLMNMRDMDQAYYFIDLAWLELCRGDKSKALTYQRRALQAADRFGAVYTQAEAQFGMAQVWHELGDAVLALEHLQQAEELGRRFGSWTMRFQCLLLRSHFDFDSGSPENALELLRTVLEMLRHHDIVTYNGWRPAVISRLCSRALEHNIHPELVLDIINRFHLQPPGDEISDKWPWPIRIHTLGHFALEVDGEAVDLATGKHRRPCTLLKQLVATEPHGIAESTLADLMWPNTDGDVAMRNLRTNLYRLRKLLGNGNAVLTIQGRLKLNQQLCWSDIQELNNALRTINERPEPPPVHKVWELLERYEGTFLPDDEGDLILKCRYTQTQRKYQAVERLAEYLRGNGRTTEAAELAQLLQSFD